MFLHVDGDFLHTVPDVGANDPLVVLQLSSSVNVVVKVSDLPDKSGLTTSSNALSKRKKVPSGMNSAWSCTVVASKKYTPV